MAISAITSNSTQQSDPGLLGSKPGEDVSQTFLTLLMTQLKAQDPTSPMDPNQMVGQLVQFNTLGEIMKIRELLQDNVTPAITPTGGN
jgi:flagellar basal-body rod modification protein FlgD